MKVFIMISGYSSLNQHKLKKSKTFSNYKIKSGRKLKPNSKILSVVNSIIGIMLLRINLMND